MLSTWLWLQNANAVERKAIDHAIELICSMLKMTPKHRASAADICSSPFFHGNEPALTPIAQLEGIDVPDKGSKAASA